MLTKLFNAYLKTITSSPKLTLLAFTSVLVLFGYFAKSIVIDNDFRKMVVQGTEDIAFLDHHNEVFGPDDTGLIITLTPNEVEPLKLISFIETLSDTFLESDDVLRVESLTHTNIIHMQKSELLIAPAYGSQALISGDYPSRLEFLKKSATARYLLSEDERSFLVTVVLDGSFKDVKRVIKPAKFVEERTREILAQSGLDLDVQFAGVPFTRVGAVDGIKADLFTLLPIAYLIVGFLLYFQFPRFHAVVLPLSAIGSSCLIAIGIASLIGEVITPLSVSFPILLLVIGIGDSLHFLSRFHEERRAGLSPVDAAIETGLTVGEACFLTSFTSAVGFGSLCLTNMPILQGFGVIASIGLITAFFVQITLMPVCLSLSSSPPLPEQKAVSSGIRTIVRKIIQPGRPLLITIGAACICLGSAIASQNLNINYFFSKILSPEHTASKGNTLLDDSFTGLLSVDVNLQGPIGSFKDPLVLKKMDELLASGSEHPGIKRAFGLPSVVKELHREFAGQDSIPHDGPTIAQLLFLAETNRAILERIVNLDYSEARLSFSKSDLGGADSLKLRDLLNRNIETIFQGTQIKAQVTGIFVLSAAGFNALVGELIESLMLALVFIILTLMLVFRSRRIGIASILPNLLPLMFVLGAYGLSGKELELMPSVMFCIAIGIAVDDTIHLIARFNEELTRRSTVAEAIEHAVQHSVGAVVNTTVILVCGFSVIALSSFPANQTSGILGGTIVGVALLADLIFVPAGLALLWKDTPP